MSKVYGLISAFKPKVVTRTRTVFSFCKEDVDEVHAMWHEIVFYKKINPSPTFEQVKKAIIADINADTDERITQGFPYTVKHGAQQGTEVNVWLSKENQSDFHAMHQNADALTFPVRYKVGEDAEGNPVYEEFADADEMHAICQQTTIHVLTCQQQGWKMKDSIDWSVYAK